MMDALSEKHARRRERDEDGFKDDLSAEDRKTELDLEAQLLRPFLWAVRVQEKEAEKEKAKKMVDEKVAATTTKTKSPRRRRSTGMCFT